MVFQSYALYPHLDVFGNIAFPLRVAGEKKSEIERAVRQAAGMLGIGDLLRARPAELSGGQRQRVTIARSLVNQPAIVWADEPTGDLDSASAGQIIDLMVELNTTQGLTFVIVTHAREVAVRTDRIVQMVDGLIVNEEVTVRGQTRLAGAAGA